MVRVGGVCSEEFTQHQGVPQGSVLSCTLFSLAISELAKVIPANTDCTLYVDDFAIYASGANLPRLTRLIQVAVNKAHVWLIERGFTVNTSKTKAVHFTKMRGFFLEPELSLGNTRIQFTEQYKFLGLIMDRKLSWKPHIQAVRNQCLKSINVLKVLSSVSWGADRASMMHIHRMLIRSKLDYGCQIYDSAPKSTLKILDPVHNLGIRLSTGAFRTSRVESLYCEAEEPSLYDRRSKLSLQLYSRLSGMPDTPTYRVVFNNAHDELFTNLRVHSNFGYRMRLLNERLALPHIPSIVMPSFAYNNEPWCFVAQAVCERRNLPKKGNAPALLLAAEHEAHRITVHINHVPIYTDGSKSPEGVGCAAVLPNCSDSRHLVGASSVYTAELMAIYTALGRIYQSPQRNFVIFSDSQSAITAIANRFTEHPLVKRIHTCIGMLQFSDKLVHLCWTPAHVGVPGNEAADSLARSATAKPIVHGAKIPMRDLYPVIKSVIWSEWESTWSDVPVFENKLRAVKSSIKEFSTSHSRNRRCETLMTRLRIGHTRLTHGYLLRGEQRPLCNECIVPLTVRHVLLECPEYGAARRRYFGTDGWQRQLDIGDVLADSQSAVVRVFSYIQDCGLLKDI